nr:hypothetical protein [Gemmatimonadales bacterium]
MPFRIHSIGAVPLRLSILFSLFALAVPLLASAQTSVGVQAIGLYSHVDPVPGGGSADEVRVVQPVVMLHRDWLGGRLGVVAMANFEGLTLRHGELAPGNWGEGFMDRRHPHTYVHELMVSGDVMRSGRVRASVSAGKGFAPFGTDDPMSRPIVRYPVNHHLAQILERAVAIAAVRAGPVAIEAGLFNGDEPEQPGQWPRVSRFGDSWSVRATVMPVTGVELQSSLAHVHSPEHRPGAGPDQRKASASVRWAGQIDGHATYAMAEWARTSEAGGFFVYRSALAEGAWSAGHQRLQWRVERTDRPEEMRTLDPYRSVRPHLENSILAETRWTTVTAGWSMEYTPGSGIRLQPLAEVSWVRVATAPGQAFDPLTFYGRDRFWSVSLGLRLGWGAPMHRMGRYGAMRESDHPSHAVSHMH